MADFEERDNDLRDFCNSKVATNMKLQTSRMARKFREYLEAVREKRKMEDITPAELNTYLGEYFKDVLREDGQEYEPDSLTTMHRAIARHLEEKNYCESIVSGDTFKLSRTILAAKRKDLKEQGKGNKPNRAESLTAADEEKLWTTQCLGTDYPGQLLNTVWYFNTKYLGFRGNDESRQLRWGDLTVKRDEAHGEFLKWNERATKTRQGLDTHQRSFAPKMFPNNENPARCPVAAYHAYASRRPRECLAPDADFYLSVKHNKRADDYTWYKRSPLGKNLLKTMMSRMCVAACIPGKKTNHLVRRTMINQLLDHGVSAHAAAEMSSHQNVGSITNYAQPGLNQQHGMASILMGERYQRTLPALRPAFSYPLPVTTTPRPPLALLLSNIGREESMEVVPSTSSGDQRLSNNQLSAMYGMFAGTTIQGGSFSFNRPH